MKILITGITGRIGANVAASLLEQGHQIRGLVWERDRRVEKLRELNVELQYGSITETEDARKAVEGVDVVYHLGAAFQGGGPFTEEEYFEINIRGTFNMLEAARKAGGIQQFLYAGTDAAYDKYIPGGMTEPIREDETPKKPRGWYPMSKSIGEDLCNGYFRTYSLPITIIRFSNVFGAGEILDYPQFYLSKMRAGNPELEALWNGEERLVLLKDERGRPHKKHIADVRDIVHGCVTALGKEKAIGETFQLGAPSPFTWDQAIPYLSERLNMSYVEANLASIPTFYEFDLSKARELIDFNPQYDIFRMIDDAIAIRAGEDIGVLPTG